MYIKKYKGSHSHRWFIDVNTGDYICTCGVKKGAKEKRAKYHNQSQVYNGISYHSKFEARYATALDYSLQSGEIKKWERQKKLELKVNGFHITNYYIDFIVHHHDGSREFVETKGYSTETFKIKWRLLEATFEDFKEHPDDIMVLVQEKSWGPPKRKKSTKST